MSHQVTEQDLTRFRCVFLYTLVALKLAAPCLMLGLLANEVGTWLFISYAYSMPLL